MKVQKINNTINNIKFKENINVNNRDASLMIQSQSAAINFARERYIAQQANSIDSSPIKALGYKLYRTFGYLTNHETPKSNNLQLNVVA